MAENKRRRLSPRRRLLVALIVIAVLAGAGFATVRYLRDYYPATVTAQTAMLGTDAVAVTEEESYYHFATEEGNGKGIIFYPGGKVDEAAYGPLMWSLASSGFDVYLMRMPFHLAIFDRNAADEVIEADKDREWILMGHSLGGAMAASYTAKHAENVSGLVLLAAYSTSDLSESNVKVLSVYGDQDHVLNRDKYESNREKLPEDATEHVIEGGNHAGFGYYGAQDGDGEAGITPREQQEEVVDLVNSVFAPRGDLQE